MTPKKATCSFFKLSVYRTYRLNIFIRTTIYNIGQIIFVTKNILQFHDKSFGRHFRGSIADRTSKSPYMSVRTLWKVTVFWTSDNNMIRTFLIDNLVIVVEISMNLPWFLYKFFFIIRNATIAMRTSMTFQMNLWWLPKLSMYRTNYLNLFLHPYIVALRIVIFSLVDFFGFFFKWVFLFQTLFFGHFSVFSISIIHFPNAFTTLNNP